MPGKTRRSVPHPQQYDFVIERLETFGNSQEPIPARLTLLRHDPQDPSQDQLFLDRMPMPREAWHYDVDDRVITWRGAFGGGQLHVSYDGRGAFGNVGAGLNPSAVGAGARAVYDCDVALDTGATFESVGERLVGFKWDTTSDAWKNAHWVKNRLELTYVSTPGGSWEPGTFSFKFRDKQTGADAWEPVTFDADLKPEESDGFFVWKLTFKSEEDPDPDEGDAPTGPDSVYPYWLQAVEDAAAQNIVGVFQIDAQDSKGTLVGLQGVHATPAAAGYYRTAPDKAPFGIFDGRLFIGGQSVATSRLSGTSVSWDNLEPQHQQRTGLPASGALQVGRGGLLAAGGGGVAAERLNTADALAAIEQHGDLHADVHARAGALRQTLAGDGLDISGLTLMRPILKNKKDEWVDVVQDAVKQDLSDIMNSRIPEDMWGLLFPGKPQQKLTGELAEVASSPVDGVADPLAWYATLATAVLTQGMANGSDPNCKNMNGPRAAAWLKSHVATSAVYHQHGQRLFHHEWQKKFDLTERYLADQINNAPKYAVEIDGRVKAVVADINANVIPDSSSPNLIHDLTVQAQAVGQYAKDNNLYWAFRFYTYYTSTGELTNLSRLMQSPDGTSLTRTFQTIASVLTALDSSGYFTKQYMSTLNIFMATNVLPSLFGFHGDAMSFDLIKEYLQRFVKENLASEDKDIREAAAKIQEILSARDSDKMIEDCISALRNFAGATEEFLALPYVAKHFVKYFKDNYPKFSEGAEIFGSLLLSGVAGLAIFSLFLQFKSFDKLNRDQRDQLITYAVQLGLQVVASVVKRGVQIGLIFDARGMTLVERAAVVGKIIVKGETDALDETLLRMGKSMTRWLADNEGNLGRTELELFGFVEIEEHEVSWETTVFGRSLDEFMATRVGPLFVLLGIGFSLYFIIADHEQGLALAGEILNIASGSLLLFAQAGGWAIEAAETAEIITEEAAATLSEFISAAGPLGILAALAGVGIMLYEMFKTPPDPVAEFVEQYVKEKTDFYVSSENSAIDYAAAYNNPDQNKLLMVGFSLSAQGKTLRVGPNGSLSAGPATALPDCVWQAATDGLGLSRIGTVIQREGDKSPSTVLLSLMSDNTVSFQPATPPPQQARSLVRRSAAAADAPRVVTQTWLSTPKGDAKLTGSGGFLVSLDLTLQPVLPDDKGNYARSQAQGWMTLLESGVFVGPDAAPPGGFIFTLTMSGMAPNFMRMADLKFIPDSKPSREQTFAPSFGVSPSTPVSFAVAGELPKFLEFHTETGTFRPNGNTAAASPAAGYSVTAKNTIAGQEHSETAEFKITVA